MNATDDRLATLASVTSEFEAQLLVNVLNDNGIAARTSGAFTAQFRAEAPGSVRVLVKSGDLTTARSTVEQARIQSERPVETEERETSRSWLIRFGFWVWLILGWVAIAFGWSQNGIQPISFFTFTAFTALSLMFLWREQAELRRSVRLGISAVLALELLAFAVLWLAGSDPISVVVTIIVATLLLAAIWRR